MKMNLKICIIKLTTILNLSIKGPSSQLKLIVPSWAPEPSKYENILLFHDGPILFCVEGL